MPVPTSRSSAAYTTSVSTPTPSRPYLSRPISPLSTNSYSPTITPVGQAVRMNVVTRIAIEGKAKQGQDGVPIKMYMKLSVPIDSISPGSTIALFPEENIKILTSQVHPLDSNSVPYNFSSTGSPLLHNAARALNLPARLPTTFNGAFRLSSTTNKASSTVSTSRSSEPEATTIPPVDPQYTGQILVSGYHIAFVLPKHFPSWDHARTEEESERSSHLPHHKRRLSIGDRNHAHFMAAIDMWVPYVTRPPRFPYLLSIPTPRCLHNNIKLRIFPPSNTASSLASLSSLEDDANTWDLTSDPHVTRTASNRLSRTSSYNHFADDESSDSSTNGFSDGFGMQGTFPSTDRIRVRWAKPMKSFDEVAGSGDTRRRVGVKDVRSEVVCIVRGKRKGDGGNGAEGIVMDVEYKASCKGIWFPGVATLLGMDVGLVAKNAEVTWLEGSPSEWNISGGVGFTGFNISGMGRPDNPSSSRTSSTDSPSIVISSPKGQQMSPPNGRPRGNSSSSTPSLLRAPLPSHNVAEYSFEGVHEPGISVSSHLGTLSSICSSSQSSAACPGVPLTLHLNMNDILPPNKTPFTFTITGTILITPRATLSRVDGTHDIHPPLDYVETTDPVSLPHFTILAADAEATKIVVWNEADFPNATVEVYSPSGDIYKDPQTRKTVLQKGGSTRCGDDGGRIALKVIGSLHDNILPGRPQTPMGNPRYRTPSSADRPLNVARQNRKGPPAIPSVKAIVTPLLSRQSTVPNAYAVRIHLSAPVNSEADWLEFGLAQVGPRASRTPLPDGVETYSPKVHIASASVDGVPAQFTMSKPGKRSANDETFQGASFETMGSTEWMNWVKIQVGPLGGDNVVIDYIVKVEPDRATWFSNWNRRQRWDLLLPTFALPVGRLEVTLEDLTGFECSSMLSNLEYQHMHLHGQKLLHFVPDDLFSPQISLQLTPTKPKKSLLSWLANALLWFYIVTSALLLWNLEQKIQSRQVHIGSPIQSFNPAVGGHEDLMTVTATVVKTVTDCPTKSPALAEPSPYLSGRSATHNGAPSRSLSTLVMSPTTVLLPPTTKSTPSTTSHLPSNALSGQPLKPLWERLGFGDAQVVLKSLPIPDFAFPSVKQKFAQYSGSLETVWKILWKLLL
ncbi:hypothetical protein P691DRAFT_692348 [Macrolepiota fuliginosa MF-IS2]|uniref:Uncharacterized protein n=1 Tax=Macrolepiota fuliginosa MF-IS2 TaxID=1400762 RepID=A0A9P5XPL9_9AGAR|nr:hypothetical protein P691DRAFT_692348 [Macrolepiota fuliginosa MF-IS2]